MLFEKSFASHPKSKFWSSKNELKPTEVSICSTKKILFNCDNCNHEFLSMISDISSKENWCPYCAGRKLCDKEDCKQCFEKSFVSHPKSKFWSSKNELKPRTVFKSTATKFYFDCECGHEIFTSPNYIFSGSFCAYCSNRKICNKEDCKKCFKNSFASHPKSQFWSSKNEISPRMIFKSTPTKFYFDCECGHEIYKHISTINSGGWCPYCCVSVKKLCEKEDCKQCFERSFASNPKSKFWDESNILSPRQVARGCDKKFWFNCEECKNKFDIALDKINSGIWCRYCTHKTEKKLYNWLKEKGYETKKGIRYDWCKNKDSNCFLPFDFQINNIIIELDGRQHFEQIKNWDSPENQLKRDIYKMKCALENNIHVIRIFQEDVWNDKNDWKNKLLETITELLDTKIPTIKLIGLKDIYELGTPT